MTASHLFQDFGYEKPQAGHVSGIDPEDIEDEKLAAFEKGYQAGWDDAVAAQNETQTFVSSALASSLQNASFEYHELRATLNGTLEAIVSGILETVLPQIAQASLGVHVREQIVALGRDMLNRTVEVAVAPQSEEAVQNALDGELPRPFVLITDDLLAATQVILRLENKEIEVHLDRTMADISSAVSAYFATVTDEVSNG